MLIDRQCRQCGGMFRIKAAVLAYTQKIRPETGGCFCSRKCYGQWRYRQSREERKCLHCGAAFDYLKVVSTYKDGHLTGKYCSKACMDAYRTHLYHCAKCGKAFRAWRALPRKYCSQRCAGVAANMVECRCVECGDGYPVVPSRVPKTKYCSRKCKNAAEGRKRTLLAKQARNRTGAKVWLARRAEVLARDMYQCRHCGETAKQLTVHHIVKWRQTQDNSFDNLITLCRPCHVAAEWGDVRRVGS